MALLEICVDTAAGLQAALDGGADRIELCSALSVGGLTPPPSLLAMAKRAPVPVRVMIRPRDGDFIYSEAELAQMVADIEAVRDAGLDGVVFGACLEGGALDDIALGRLIAASGPLGKTLHRAFDLTPDPFAALESAIALGFDTILTSGMAPTALDGAGLIAELVNRADGRIEIMGGAGVGPDSAAELIKRTGARIIHGSGARVEREYSSDITGFGFAPDAAKRATDTKTVAALKAACH